MINRRKLIIISISIILLIGSIYIGVGVHEYFEFISVVSASGGCPTEDGGTITTVRQPCVLDTPMPYPTTCGESCPQLSMLAEECVSYIELDLDSQLGTTFLAVPLGFQYKGGGQFPEANMDFLFCGISNIEPIDIGIPSSSAMRIKKILDFFDYAIAGFKNK